MLTPYGVMDVRARKYKDAVDRVLFEGHYSDSESKILVSQSHRESEVLSSGILLAEIYTPANMWRESLVGTYADDALEAYSLRTAPAYLKHRILERVVGGDETIVAGRFTDFDEVLTFIREDPKDSFHLSRQKNGLWFGKHIRHGFLLAGQPQRTGYSETTMVLTQPKADEEPTGLERIL